METCKLYIRRKFPDVGYDDAWPKLPFVFGLVSQWLIRDLEDGVSRKWGFWMFRDVLDDEDCLNIAAVGRDPKIIINMLFPYLLKDNPTIMPGWCEFLGKCRAMARNVKKPGECNCLEIPVSKSWCEE